VSALRLLTAPTFVDGIGDIDDIGNIDDIGGIDEIGDIDDIGAKFNRGVCPATPYCTNFC